MEAGVLATRVQQAARGGQAVVVHFAGQRLGLEFALGAAVGQRKFAVQGVEQAHQRAPSSVATNGFMTLTPP